MTSLAEERAEQQRWKLRPSLAGLGVFNRLVENEFASPEDGDAWEARALRAVVQFAVAQVPHYRDLFARLRLGAGAIRDRRDLPLLPPLHRQQLREHFEKLKPAQLPPGVEIYGLTRSSGSTGPPTTVVSSVANNVMFSYLNQRHARWYRLNPVLTLALIRLADSLPQVRPGVYLADGEILRRPQWPYTGTFFETGPAVGFNVTNPVEAQVEWLRSERPDYLLTRSHSLEHLAMAAAGERPCDSLLAMTAISEALTAPARRHLQAVFGAPVHQGYGLNEIGMVAVRCEHDRYHVHREHCVVEIVDEAGMPVPGGERGRLLVTGLKNLAMPLIRYDTDDLVTALDAPCACGRTLPSFGEIHGRYSRIATLPAGTLERVDVLRAALRGMPLETARPLRRYQIRRLRDESYELRIVAAAAMPRAFRDRLERTWSNAVGAAGPPLTIRDVTEIPLDTHIDKFDDFVSE
jgi:phenylacetate-CoA ligase